MDLSDPANPTFDLDPIGQEIGTCKVYNSFDYRPAIHLEKVNTPPQVRGDLADNPKPGDPPASVASDFTVTNPGNTPLSSVHVNDGDCGPVSPVLATGFNAGDTNKDNELDPGEEWKFACDHEIKTGASTDPAGQTVINTATATGTPPVGNPVSDDDDATPPRTTPRFRSSSRSTARTPRRSPRATTANYTYDVTNTGNTPLQNVTLEDATTDPSPPACSPLVRGAAGNGDDILDVGETWHYTCTNNPAEDVVDTATATADPVNPIDRERVRRAEPAGERYRYGGSRPGQPEHPAHQVGQPRPASLSLPGVGDSHLHIHGHQPGRRAVEPARRATCRKRAERNRPGLGRGPTL